MAENDPGTEAGMPERGNLRPVADFTCDGVAAPQSASPASVCDLGQTPQPAPPDPFLRNLLLIVGLLLFITWWIDFYTDRVVIAWALLGLGTAITIPALVFKLFTEQRSKDVLALIDRLISSNRLTSVTILILWTAAALVFSTMAAVEVRSIGESTDRVVRVRRDSTRQAGEPRLLRAGQSVRIPFFTTWLGPVRLSVAVEGCGTHKIVLGPWARPSETRAAGRGRACDSPD